MHTQITVPPAAVHLHMFASKDEHRSNLRGVLITRISAIRWAAVATNGHTLTKVEWPVAEDDMYAGEPLLVSAAALKELGRVAKKGEAVIESVEGGELRGRAKADTGIVVSLARLYETFPDWRQVIPKDASASKGSYGVNPAYLVAMSQHAERYVLGKRLPALAYRGGGSLDPIEYRAETIAGGVEVTYIIMPIRL